MLWNDILASFPGAHFLQTFEWAQIKALNGWKAEYWVWRVQPGQGVKLEILPVNSQGEFAPGSLSTPLSGASPRALTLLLTRRLPVAGFALRTSVMYAPKGPLLDWNDAPLRRQVLSDLERLSRKRGAIFVKIDPDLPLGWGTPGSEEARAHPPGAQVAGELKAAGWRFSGEQVQFRNTVLVDLTPAEEEILARMKQKTRYNIRLAERKGVRIRTASLDDLDLLFEMYKETSARDGFLIRDPAYYRHAWGTLMRAGLAEPLVAEVEGAPVAGVVIVRFAGRAYYYNGMSRQQHREKMPSYLIQWEAMRRAKLAGCTVYDLWGAPDEFVETDPMWGVYRFKEGLGGEAVRTLGAYDFAANSWLYQLYTHTLPRLFGLLRSRRG